MTHEQRILRMYSYGPGIGSFDPNSMGRSDREYLSLGYWDADTKTYHQAAHALLQYVLDHAGFSQGQRILDVACGYGAETFSIVERFKPESVAAIDITPRHVAYAAGKALHLGLDGCVGFQQANACSLPFGNGRFNRVLAVEGPAQFCTRAQFFREAYRVLTPHGEMIVTDAIVTDNSKTAARWERMLLKTVARSWLVPPENCVSNGLYRTQLQRSGFAVLSFESLGRHVFPGYAANAFDTATYRARVQQRGVAAATVLTAISYVLGALYQRGLIDYVFVKARKR